MIYFSFLFVVFLIVNKYVFKLCWFEIILPSKSWYHSIVRLVQTFLLVIVRVLFGCINQLSRSGFRGQIFLYLYVYVQVSIASTSGIYMYICICIHVYASIYMYMYICLCMYICIYICICMHVYIYIYHISW